MNSKSVLAAVMAMSLGLGNVAFAQPNDPPNVRDNMRQGNRQGNQPRGQRNVQRPRTNQNMQRGSRADQSAERGPGTYQNDRRGGSGYQNPERGPGAGPDHNFYRGERLPQQYRHNNYVVDDWRGHHLSAPPRGYHWVQTGSDYVLVAIATGIIMQILLQQ